jgi:hypothetical protein
MNHSATLLDLLQKSPPNQFLPADFRSPGYFLGKLDPRVLETLSQEVKSIESDFSKGQAWNHELAGQIKREFFLKESLPIVAPYFINLAQYYNRQFMGVETGDHWELLDLWVNFQKKHEYNPPHNHKGALSFVVWMRMPFDIEEEMKAVNSRGTTSPCAANFAFLYTQADGKLAMENIPVDRRFEGMICVFPASIHHTVYPFTTSDEFRVSISGNLAPKS